MAWQVDSDTEGGLAQPGNSGSGLCGKRTKALRRWCSLFMETETQGKEVLPTSKPEQAKEGLKVWGTQIQFSIF